MKLSVCIIVAESKTIGDTLFSVADIADEICVLQTKEHVDTKSILDAFASGWHGEFKYQLGNNFYNTDGFPNSFSEMRNANFAMATGDLILWIDSDDTLSDPIALRKELEKYDAMGVDQFIMDYDYEFSADGVCTTRHKRERVVRNGYFKWIAPIHEVLSPIRRATMCNVLRNVCYIKHNNIQSKPEHNKTKRNLTMLSRIVAGPECDARMKMYYAHCLVDAKQYDKALQYYSEYLEESQWQEERYNVMLRVYNLFKLAGKIDIAKVYAMKAIDLFPKYKDAYLCIAEACAISERWEDVIEWVEIADQKQPVGQDMVHNPHGQDVQPLILLQQAYAKVGDFQRSLQCTEQLLRIMPHRAEQLKAFGQSLMKEINDQKLINTFETILSVTPEERHSEVYGLIPESIQDYPHFKKNLPKPRPDGKRVCAIYCGYDDTRSWGPEDIFKGIGGSEEAVINMSRELTALGWCVEIYTNCTQEGNIDGVNWYQTAAANPNDIVDLTILWRHPHHVFHAPKGRVTWLWLHDLANGQEPYYDADVMARLDKVIFLSQFHRTTAPWVPDEKVMLSRNGIDLKLLVPPDNDPYTVIYASSPDRGLDTVLDIWDKVIAIHPQAKLKVFYGFNAWFDKRYENNAGMMAWKAKLLKKMADTPSIDYRGSVGQDVLAKEFASSGVWIYPTTFGEISCCVGDTPILMPRDHQKHPYGIPIKELVGKSGFHVYSYDHQTNKIVLGKVNKVWKSRENATLLRITLDDGTVLRFTPEHLFMTRDGEYKQARDLVVGESLMPCYERPTFMIKQPSGHWDYEHRMAAEAHYGPIPDKFHVDHKNGNRYDNSIDNLQVLSPSDHAMKSFQEDRIISKITKRNMSLGQKMVANTPEGIARHKAHGKNGANKFWDDVRSWPEEKRKAWFRSRVEKKKNKQLHNHKVVSIEEDCVQEDVYDMEVDVYHNFAAGGVFVHNCITGMKAQALGAIPVCSAYAALEETVRHGYKHGSTTEPEFDIDEITNTLCATIGDKEAQNVVRTQMVPDARMSFSWEGVAKEWNKAFLEDSSRKLKAILA